MLAGLIEGRIVHYVLAPHDVPVEFSHCVGLHRPALVVNAWPYLDREDGYSNLTVFVDWSNDGNFDIDEKGRGVNRAAPSIWATSRIYSEDKTPGTWHWIERTEAATSSVVPPAGDVVVNLTAHVLDAIKYAVAEAVDAVVAVQEDSAEAQQAEDVVPVTETKEFKSAVEAIITKMVKANSVR